MKTIVFITWMLCGSVAFASGRGAYIAYAVNGSVTMEYAWRDGVVRRQDFTKNHYVLLRSFVLRGGRLYRVVQTWDRPQEWDRLQVLDLTEAMKKPDSRNLLQADLKIRSFALESTGKQKTIAGLRGTVYMADVVYADGRRAEEEMVLSDDPRVVALTQAHLAMMTAQGAELEPMQKQLAERALGLLSHANLTLVSVSGIERSNYAFLPHVKPVPWEAWIKKMKSRLPRHP